MKALRRTTTAGLACAAALGLFAAVLPTAFTAPSAQAAPIVVPPSAPLEYPTNLALTGTVTASSVEAGAGAGFTADLINDGNTGTRWSSAYEDNSWIQVELEQAGPVDHVKIVWPNAAAREYKLQTSLDGTSWTDVKTMTSSTGPTRTDEVTLGVANTKFLRMQGVKRWSTYGYSISEFEIYDKAQPVVPDGLALVPMPVASAATADGTFRLLPSSRIVATDDALDAANYFAQKARKSTGFALPVVTGTATANDVQITVAPESSEDKPESYTLQADADGAKIAANTSAGALNGVQTLRQLFPQWIESSSVVSTPWTVDGIVISDYPRYEHRGIQIDVARSFYTVDEMKEHIDNAAQFKFNRLHLHLSDDQGWRIAIDQPAVNPSNIKYSDLTDISGKTAMLTNQWQSEVGHTGFYTQDDYKEIVKYAGDNGMVVIPEVDMPGHTNAALHAIPQLNSAKSLPKPPAGKNVTDPMLTADVGGTAFDADNPATYEFTKEVLTQLAALTPGPYLHIGGDEAPEVSDVDYKKMIDAFSRQVTALDKQVIGWSEYGTANLPPNSVIQAWTFKTQQDADNIIRNNAKVILSPTPKTYIPQKQDVSQEAGPAWACGGPCTLEEHYDWDPAKYLPGIGDDRILGVETVHWGEFLRTMEQIESYQYPRTLATAEVAWSQQSDRDYTDFSRRVGTLGGRMALEGVNHFKTSGIDWSTAPAAPATAPATTDLASLPEVSPVDLGVPSTEFDGGEFVTMQNLPANAWLQLAIQDSTGESAPAWVRSNAAREAPLEVPADITAGEYVVTVQSADGELAGFAALAIAEDATPETSAPATTPPATTEPSDEATDDATEPTDESTEPTVTDPATDDAISASPTQGTTSPTTPSSGTNPDDLASTGSTSSLLIGGAALALLAGLVLMAGSRRRVNKH